ncbi:hypothetical protein L7F22_062430 [Adiantum nelumboides]|nr:hypothetical protein [Adiantum nelumboides]
MFVMLHLEKIKFNQKNVVIFVKTFYCSLLPIFRPAAEELMQSSNLSPTDIIAKAIAKVAGHTELRRRSLITGQDTFATMMLQIGKPMYSATYVFNCLRRGLPEDTVVKVKGMSLTKDNLGAVFDIPSELVNEFLAAASNDRFTITLLDSLPDLQARPDRNPQGRSGQGGRGGGRSGGGRGSSFSGRGSFGGPMNLQGRGGGNFGAHMPAPGRGSVLGNPNLSGASRGGFSSGHNNGQGRGGRGGRGRGSRGRYPPPSISMISYDLLVDEELGIGRGCSNCSRIGEGGRGDITSLSCLQFVPQLLLAVIVERLFLQ